MNKPNDKPMAALMIVTCGVDLCPDLAKKKNASPVRVEVPPMELEQARGMIGRINSDWELIRTHHIERIWAFPDFDSALQFVNAAGAICEEQDRHADFELGWGRVKAMIWTHKINGLTESDFVLAAKFDG